METRPEPWRRRSPLNTVITEMMRVVAADDEDRISQLGVAAAIDELIELDNSRAGSWYLEGVSYGFGLRDSERTAPDEDLERWRIAGILDAAVEQRDHERLAAAAIRHEPRLREIVEAGTVEAAVAPMLLALLPRHPERAVNLAAASAMPFPGWEMFVERAEKRGQSLRDAWEPDRADVVITGLAAVIAAWRAGGADDPLLARSALRLALARASMHREAGDFETAARLLNEIDAGTDDLDAGPPGVFVEQAMTHLRLARLDDARIAQALGGDLGDLASPPPPALEAIANAVKHAPDDPAANLLAGVVALGQGEPATAGGWLEAALAGLGHQVRPSFRDLLRERVEALRAP